MYITDVNAGEVHVTKGTTVRGKCPKAIVQQGTCLGVWGLSGEANVLRSPKGYKTESCAALWSHLAGKVLYFITIPNKSFVPVFA